MRIGDLPNSETCAKLMMISFSSPKKNLDVYKMVQACETYNAHVTNERAKLLSRYGEQNEDGTVTLKGDAIETFNKAMNEILDMEYDREICIPDLTEADFEEGNCQYPTDKRFWINGRDIMAVLSFIDKSKKERDGKNGI